MILVAMTLTLTIAAMRPEEVPDAVRLAREVKHREAERWARFMAESARRESSGVPAAQNLDVLHYDMDVTVDPTAMTLKGTVVMRFRATASLSKVKMRLIASLKVTGAAVDDVAISKVKRSGADLKFPLSPAAAPGSEHTIRVEYEGPPGSGDGYLNGGFVFSSHAGVPVAATSVEPYDSYTWWPCVEDVADKFTIDLRVTVPDGLTVAANGKLVETYAARDGWTTWHWSEGYPIAGYLVALNMTNYATFGDTYTGLDGTTTMPVDHYVYPEDLATARRTYARVAQMIHFHAGLSGEYPFIGEKYGQVEVPYPGMEHQTLTAVSDYWTLGEYGYGGGTYELMYFHEMSHHWWGDDVTCGTWHDVWLNEGFGTYFEVLWLSQDTGTPVGELMAEYYDGAWINGTVYVKDASRPFADEGAVYDKGAWVLHMLRHVMGDEPFFQALAGYRSAHRYGSAVTADFQAACEGAYGGSLAWFFDQWVYTRMRPVYSVSDSISGNNATVTIGQLQTHKIANRKTDRTVYHMPVDLTIHYADGTSDTVTVDNDQRSQTFELEAAKPIASVGFDEGHFILKEMR
jgi:aminopeptidase N